MTPIVLHHGLFGHGNWDLGPIRWRYFHVIDQAIAARGYPLIVTAVHPTASVATRARQLKEGILSRLSEMNLRGQPVVIIAHSLGGLDSRYMISRLGMASQVKALVTISTPHRGSTYADWCVRHIGRRFGALRLLKSFGVDMQGAVDLTLSSCRQFNETVADQPQVKYYSVSAAGALGRMPAFFRHSHRLITAAEGPNDGLVSVASAQWGEHLGTWTADHFLTINRRLAPRPGDGKQVIGLWMAILERLVAEGLLEPAGL
jgi:triacylglycerol lipase